MDKLIPPRMEGQEFLIVKNITKVYSNGYKALNSVSFKVNKGEFLAIIGLSGSGKSTLLKCINKLQDPSGGKIFFNGQEITALKGKHLRKLRSKIGMIFQNFNIIPRSSVISNVLVGSLARVNILPSFFNIFPKKEKQDAYSFIKEVGLEGREQDRADQLSGGEQQRVAIARALLQGAELLLADEPVSSLDPVLSHSVLRYLQMINEKGTTVLCNLHFLSLVHQYATRVIALKEGQIVFDGFPYLINENNFKSIYGDEARGIIN